MAEEPVLFERRGSTALLTLNRPDRLNAWTGALADRYFTLLDECADDPDVRVVVVTGAGRGFCAGADMDMLQGIGSGGGERAESARAGLPQWHTTTIPKPVIAAINGACAGIGLVQALMCDLRFAAAGAKFTTAFSRRGLVAEHGISWVLPRLVGPARALDLLLSGRTFLADEAAELGVVNRVLPPDELLPAALDYAQELATWSSPSSMAVMKAQVWHDLGVKVDEAGGRAAELMVRSLREADFREGVQSFLEKRSPQFPPLPGGWATDED